MQPHTYTHRKAWDWGASYAPPVPKGGRIIRAEELGGKPPVPDQGTQQQASEHPKPVAPPPGQHQGMDRGLGRVSTDGTLQQASEHPTDPGGSGTTAGGPADHDGASRAGADESKKERKPDPAHTSKAGADEFKKERKSDPAHTSRAGADESKEGKKPDPAHTSTAGTDEFKKGKKSKDQGRHG